VVKKKEKQNKFSAGNQMNVADVKKVVKKRKLCLKFPKISATAAETVATAAETVATAAKTSATAAETVATAAETLATAAETVATAAELKKRRFRGPGKNKKEPVAKEKKAKKQELLARAFFISSTLPLESPLRYKHWNNVEKSSNHTVMELKNFFQRYEAIYKIKS
jgi:hypothetical protein